MAVSVNYGGNTYSIPQSGERNWGALTNYLVALASGASTTAFIQNVRVSTIASTSILTTDFAVFINFAGSASATLPSGVTKQIFAIFDKSGSASSNNITIATTGGQLIDGQSSFVIKSNYGGIIVQYDGTAWKILSEYQGNQPLRVNNTTNTSFTDVSVEPKNTSATANDGQSATVTFVGTKSFLFTVSLDSGESILCSASYSKAGISAVSDTSEIFLSSDAGTGIYISKSDTSNTVSIKNRMGSAKVIEVKSLTSRIASATAWA